MLPSLGGGENPAPLPHAAFSACLDVSTISPAFCPHLNVGASCIQPPPTKPEAGAEPGPCKRATQSSRRLPPVPPLAVISSVYLQGLLIISGFDTYRPEHTQCCEQAFLKPTGSFFRFPVLLLLPPADHPETFIQNGCLTFSIWGK